MKAPLKNSDLKKLLDPIMNTATRMQQYSRTNLETNIEYFRALGNGALINGQNLDEESIILSFLPYMNMIDKYGKILLN